MRQIHTGQVSLAHPREYEADHMPPTSEKVVTPTMPSSLQGTAM